MKSIDGNGPNNHSRRRFLATGAAVAVGSLQRPFSFRPIRRRKSSSLEVLGVEKVPLKGALREATEVATEFFHQRGFFVQPELMEVRLRIRDRESTVTVAHSSVIDDKGVRAILGVNADRSSISGIVIDGDPTTENSTVDIYRSYFPYFRHVAKLKFDSGDHLSTQALSGSGFRPEQFEPVASILAFSDKNCHCCFSCCQVNQWTGSGEMAICDISCNVTCDRFCPAQPICAILCYAACQGFCQEGTGHTSDCDVCSSFCKDQNPLFKGCCVTCAHANCTDAKHRKVEVHS